MVMPSFSSEQANQSGPIAVTAWSPLLSSSLATLRRLAGTTEREFLQIGTRMQGIYQRSLTLSQTAYQLVEVASGERLQTLIDRLREILDEMNNYLAEAQNQSLTGHTTLQSVGGLLQKVGEPLVGVRRMCKHLYMLEVSIKIESAYMGEMGNEFINLAMDIKKLSQQIKDKVAAIQEHRNQLAGIITQNGAGLENGKDTRDAATALTLSNTAMSLGELETANAEFSQLGNVISEISTDSSNNISTIVESMQFHDIYRQQVEHVIEGLEGLQSGSTTQRQNDFSGDAQRAIIGKTGDVCELQEAQLHYASTELYGAVTSIVDSLRAIGVKQKQMTRDIFARTGGRKETRAGSDSGNSFIARLSTQMNAITSLLAGCALSNNEMTATMKGVTETVRQITGYVSDIEGIGHDIIQIALNARIKAASTGQEGASLSVLAEEIGQMSGEAVQRTDEITTTLTQIHSATDVLSTATNIGEEDLSAKLAKIEEELNGILATLDVMGGEMSSLLVQVEAQVKSLSKEIATIADSIDIHERTKAMADEVLEKLRTIFHQARQLHPASAEFKEDLRQMAHRYTMESERRIHENIAGRHGVGPARQESRVIKSQPPGESEFGDNVDLF
jgi:methyl-accepting chemotaxis protein